MAHPPGAEPAWAASGLSHGAAWGGQASPRRLALHALGPAGAARPCAGAAGSALWLAEVLPLPAGVDCAPRA